MYIFLFYAQTQKEGAHYFILNCLYWWKQEGSKSLNVTFAISNLILLIEICLSIWTKIRRFWYNCLRICLLPVVCVIQTSRHHKKDEKQEKGDKNRKFFTHKEDHKDDRQLHLLIVIPVDANIGTHAKIPEQHNPNRVAADLLSNTGKTICRQIFVLTGQKTTC